VMQFNFTIDSKLYPHAQKTTGLSSGVEHIGGEVHVFDGEADEKSEMLRPVP